MAAIAKEAKKGSRSFPAASPKIQRPRGARATSTVSTARSKRERKSAQELALAACRSR
jgi:hypothetical protein